MLRAAMAATCGWRTRPVAGCAPACTCRANKKAAPGDGLSLSARLRLPPVLLAAESADFVEACSSPLVQDLGSLGAGLRGNGRDFTTVIGALVQHLLGVFGVLGDAGLGGGGLRQIAQQRREALERLAGQFELPLRQRLDAFDGKLVGLAERLDVAALRRPDRLDIEGPETEIGENLGNIKIERVHTSVRHGRVPIKGAAESLCGAQSLYRA